MNDDKQFTDIAYDKATLPNDKDIVMVLTMNCTLAIAEYHTSDMIFAKESGEIVPIHLIASWRKLTAEEEQQYRLAFKEATITEEAVQLLGFEKVDTYPHDQFRTNQYRKGYLEVDFTYEGDRLENVDVMVDEDAWIKVNMQELQQLDNIINKEE